MPIRLGILSDIHAFGDRAKANGSMLDMTGANPNTRNPLTDLLQHVKETKTEVDLLFCAGDICNQADLSGFARAWPALHQLRALFCAKQLIATCGNHDLNSRYLDNEEDPDPKGSLQQLDPPFPFEDQSLNDRFWARNFAILEPLESVQVLVLNTSAFHGGKEGEIEHGRVSRRTIEAIRTALRSSSATPIRILLLHHHPIPLHGWKNQVDGEFVKKGQELLDMLHEESSTPWLVIHGHRHSPRLVNSASSSSAVRSIVLGAGSFGAAMTGVPNQFHIVELETSTCPTHAPVVGKIATWSWTLSTRWTDAIQAGGLPPLCGFGYQGQLGSLVDQVRSVVSNTYTTWQEVEEKVPSVTYLLPDDLKKLCQALEQGGISVIQAASGKPASLGRP